jgi:excisionase family DNA binding protein
MTQTAHDEPDLLIIEDVATLTRVTPETVRRWCRAGRLPSVRIGLRRLVRRSDLESLWEPTPDGDG